MHHRRSPCSAPHPLHGGENNMARCAWPTQIRILALRPLVRNIMFAKHNCKCRVASPKASQRILLCGALGLSCTQPPVQTNLHRATCAESRTQTKLHRATCPNPFAQRQLRKATAQNNLRNTMDRGEQSGNSLSIVRGQSGHE